MTLDQFQESLGTHVAHLRSLCQEKGYKAPDVHIGFGYIGYDTCVRVRPEGWQRLGTIPSFFYGGDEPLTAVLRRACQYVHDLPHHAEWTDDVVGRTLGIGPAAKPAAE